MKLPKIKKSGEFCRNVILVPHRSSVGVISTYNPHELKKIQYGVAVTTLQIFWLWFYVTIELPVITDGYGSEWFMPQNKNGKHK